MIGLLPGYWGVRPGEGVGERQGMGGEDRREVCPVLKGLKAWEKFGSFGGH